MAREIKFRAWVNGFLPAQSGMFYGLDLYRNTISGGYDRIGVWRNNNRYHFKSEEEPFELMQYTGLKDKNGVEIYEGDILRIGSSLIEEVKWVGVGDWVGAKQPMVGFISYETIYPKPIEVIGNIYENPELLRSQDEH